MSDIAFAERFESFLSRILSCGFKFNAMMSSVIVSAVLIDERLSQSVYLLLVFSDIQIIAKLQKVLLRM